MVSCKHCSTPNSLDSTFCKRCGTALPAEDVQVAQEKLNVLIAEGNTAFNEGRTDEAMAVSESALLSNPSSVPALSLKAMCHERRGELALALECADMIVDLNPDSELDKIKRNQLRTKLSVSVQLATQPPDRRTALIGAVATVILVICIGIGAAKVINRPDTVKQVANNPIREASISQTNPTVGTQPNAGNPTLQTTQQPNNRGPVTPLQNNNVDEGAQPSGIRPFDSGSMLPRTTGDGGADPIVIEGPLSNRQPGSTQAPVATNTTVKRPTAEQSSDSHGLTDDPAPSPDKSATTQPEEHPGLVDIQISNGGRKQFGGSVDVGPSGGGAVMLDKVGIQRFNLGSYGPAASSFEQALRAGGDQVAINQWLGRCYDHLGKRSDEIEAYKRCVTACQAAIGKGAGNKDRIRGIMDTCQQELKVLQGN